MMNKHKLLTATVAGAAALTLAACEVEMDDSVVDDPVEDPLLDDGFSNDSGL